MSSYLLCTLVKINLDLNYVECNNTSHKKQKESVQIYMELLPEQQQSPRNLQ